MTGFARRDDRRSPQRACWIGRRRLVEAKEGVSLKD
jgi:hypothetical protein